MADRTRRAKINYVMLECNRPVLWALVRKRLRDASKHRCKPGMTLGDFLHEDRKRIKDFLREHDYNETFEKMLYPRDRSKTKLKDWDLELLIRFLIHIFGVSSSVKRYLIKTLNVGSELRCKNGTDCTRNEYKHYMRNLKKMRNRCYKRLRDQTLKDKTEELASYVSSSHVNPYRAPDANGLGRTDTYQWNPEGNTEHRSRRKWYTIKLLLDETACDVLRALVKQTAKEEGYTLDRFLRRHRRRIYRRIGCLDEPERQLNILYPEDRVPTDISKWDIYLICFILLNVCHVHENVAGHVAAIRRFNNEFIHYKQCGLTDSQNENYLNTLKVAINGCLYDIEDKELKAQVQSLLFKYESDRSSPIRENGILRQPIVEEAQKESTPWTACIKKRDEAEASRLIQQQVLPSNKELSVAFDVFGRLSNIFLAICRMINEVIRNESQNIDDTWTSYRPGQNEIVFVVVTKDKSTKITIADYNIHIKCTGERNPASARALSQACQSFTEADDNVLDMLRECISDNASDLMKKHSKLSVILPNLKRSIGNTAIHKPCITLCVSVKGLIPIKEDPFPRTIDGFQVDVVEGVFAPYVGRAIDPHEHLKIGLAISGNATDKDGRMLSGTLGGFVWHPDHGLCGIGSAHTLLSKDDLLNYKPYTKYSNRPVFQPPGLESFGEIETSVCDAGNQLSPGMEVVLFKINQRHPIDGSFPVALNDGEAGFDDENPLTFNSGAIIGRSEIKKLRKELYKFGAKTGITRGAFAYQGGAVRLQDITGQSFGLDFSLTDQIVVLKIGGVPFAEPGDSGALVMCAGENNDSAAVGIIVGGLEDIVFVTPICDILQNLGCSGGMCQFSTSPNMIRSPDSGFGSTSDAELMDFL